MSDLPSTAPVTEDEYNALPPASRELIEQTLLAADYICEHPSGHKVFVDSWFESDHKVSRFTWADPSGTGFSKRLVLNARNCKGAKVDRARGLIVFKPSKHVRAFRPFKLLPMITENSNDHNHAR